MATSLCAPSAAAVGRLLCDSFSGLLRREAGLTRVERVHAIVDRVLHSVDPTMSLFVFGSTAAYGWHEPGCDVDFVVLTAADVQAGRDADAASELAKSVQTAFLRRLAEGLKQDAAGARWELEMVRRTRVPVLRARNVLAVAATEDAARVADQMTGVDFDITARRRNGVRNSALLRAYFVQCPAARWLGIAVKRWSKAAGVNLAVPGGCLSSYGLNLMVVFYLLRRGLVQFVPCSASDVAGIAPMPAELPLTLPDGASWLGGMVLDFLEFYLNEFDPTTAVVSLSREEPTTKTMLGWTTQAEDLARIRGEKIHYGWCIEDPFEENLNVGRYVTPFKLTLLRRHLERARQTALLLSPN